MSGTSTELKAVFTAEDRTTEVLRSIGASLRGLVGTGLGRFAATTAELGRGLASMAQGAALTAASIVGLSGAASAAGLASLAVSTAATAAKLRDLAASSRVPIERLEVLLDIGRRAGISQDDLAGGLGVLNERMRGAARGGNLELRQVMSRLGISLRDANGRVRNAADVLPQLAQAFSRVADPALRAQLATALFGESGAKLLPILTGGAAGLREGEERFRRYGVSVAANSEALADAHKKFEDLRASLTGFAELVSVAIGTELAPVLAPLAGQMADWIASNREVIATDIAKYIGDMARAARDFLAERGPIERLQDFALQAQAVVKAMGGVRTIMLGFAALVAAPFIAALVSIVTNLGLIIGVLARLSLVLATTPFGWALAAVAALAAGAYLLWTRWDEVAGALRRIWDRVVAAWGPQVLEVARLVAGLGRAIVEPLMAAWRPVAEFFTDMLQAIGTAFSTAWARIQPIADRLIEAARAMNARQNETSNPRMTPEAQAERSRRTGARRIEGFDDDRPVWSGLPSEGASGLYVGPSARGSIEATIRFENAPPGTRVEAMGSGIVQQPRTDLGLNLRTRLP